MGQNGSREAKRAGIRNSVIIPSRNGLGGMESWGLWAKDVVRYSVSLH